MKIGFTYDLRDDYLKEGFGEEETAEFDKPETIDTIESAIKELGHSVERIGNVKNLVTALAGGKRWGLVFNIAEGMYGLGREAQVPALLDAYNIPYTFSDPLTLALSLHKGITKRVVRDCGVDTPDFAIVETSADISKIKLPFPLFVKPAAEGTGKGINAHSRVTTPAELKSICSSVLEKFKQPVLVETYLSGREFTVGILGSGDKASAIGVMEVVFNDCSESSVYSYANKTHYEKRVEYRLVGNELGEQCKQLALRAWRGLGCRDAGRIDLRADSDGKPYFLEVNPLAGLNHIHSDLCILSRLVGISFNELIAAILESAMRRI